LSIRPPYVMPENLFELEIVYDNPNCKINILETVEPYEIMDRYMPNRHGVVFKELLYAGDLLHTSFDIRLRREFIKSNTGNAQTFDKKAGKVELSQICIVEDNVDNPIKEKVRMKLELYRGSELLNTWDFYNGITLHHLYLEGVPYIPPVKGAKGEQPKEVPNVPYIMICYVDLTEVPNWMKKQNTCSDIGWIIRVFSNETIGFVKDTSKEDMERALKESWEIAEPGRAEKAKKSRAKYLLQLKKEKGEELTYEEEQLLNEERERKAYTQSEENLEKNNQDKNNKLKGLNISGKKAENKNNKINPTTKPSSVQPTPIGTKIDFNKPLPRPEEHTTKYLKEFLEYCYQERVCVLDNNYEQENSNTILT
jgi:hypothetical protein